MIPCTSIKENNNSTINTINNINIGIFSSLYVKEGAYSDLPSYLINYEYMKNNFGIEGLNIINNITNEWIENPYLLFRNYSIYYFKKEFEEYEKGNIYQHKTRVYKKD